MATKKLTVVISQSQGKNPAKHQLEEELTAALMMEPVVDVSLVPHLYDLSGDHTGTIFLRSLPGDSIVLAWMYPRATRWILDRHGMKGRAGVTLLKNDDEDDFEDDRPDNNEPDGIGSVDVPDRKIYCVDLRDHSDAQVYLDEILRIANDKSVQTVDLMSWIQGQPKAEQLQRYLHSTSTIDPSNAASENAGDIGQFDHAVKRRWYPVIDYDRCTNCMECIDFCLFGVYGVDKLDRILVEQPDDCKKGCPACSRVCPENAIVFPGHKTPAIAGADGEIGGLKIDLSKLFGAPSALDVAIRERDVELVDDGREAVGMTVGIPKRRVEKQPQERDELDDLIDSLNDLDL